MFKSRKKYSMTLVFLSLSYFYAMNKLTCTWVLLFFICFGFYAQSPWIGNTSPSYAELIQYLKKVDKESDRVELYAMGASDVVGLPIYLCIVNGSGDSLKTFEKARTGTSLLINNAIHPGEPDGINACLIYLDQFVKKDSINPNDPVFCFIPAYNVGGMLVRSSTSRANQNGPEQYGFRGNAQNLDLNRDFMKMDSENAHTFAKIFHALDPDVFVDNHVSNGADYQYTLTYITSVRERLAPSIRHLIYGQMLPVLTKELKKMKWDLFPYVETKSDIPDSGIVQFNDLPRYAMGFASLFHCISITVETHMLKPFPNRVKANHDFLDELVKWSVLNQEKIELARDQAKVWDAQQKHLMYNFQRTEEQDSILFKGFEAVLDSNEFTGLSHLKYDRTKPYQKTIPYFRHFVAKDSVEIPSFYIVKGQETRIIRNLQSHGILFETLRKDQELEVNCMIVKQFSSLSNPYEGHYMHAEKQVEKVTGKVKFKAGDVVIPTNQNGAFFLHNCFQPLTEDSYFTWNYFDSYLQEKEYFSNYVFVEKVRSILYSNPGLKQEFDEKKEKDAEFAKSEWQQLYFLYQHSPYFEPSYRMLPVYELK